MEEPKSHHKLYEVISRMRVTAGLVFDKGTMQGLTPQMIQNQIQPLSDQLDQVIAEASKGQLGDVVTAVNCFEFEAQGFEQSAKVFIEKAAQARHHATQLREALAQDMQRKGEHIRDQEGFTASLIREVSGKYRLVLR